MKGLHFLGVAACVAWAGCGGSSGSPQAGVRPDLTDDGWEVALPQEQGLALERLVELERQIAEGRYARPDALLVTRNGRLVYERYWNGFDRDAPHDLRSATKSLTSTMIGIAREAGLLPSLDAPVAELLSRYGPLAHADSRKARLTARHLLEMRSGLACDDWVADSPGQEERMYRSRDWVKFALNLPMAYEPGERTQYCTAGVVLLGAVLKELSGEEIPELSGRLLFEPLGIGAFRWEPAAGGNTDTGGHLHLRPRDLLKVGQTYLDGGLWQGRRVVSEAWVRESAEGRHPMGDSLYGFLWWVNTFMVNGTSVPTYFARGNGGQHLFVFPSLGMTAAFTGSHYNDPEMDQPIEMAGRYLIPAALPSVR